MNKEKQKKLLKVIKLGKYFADENGNIFSRADKHGGLKKNAHLMRARISGTREYPLICLIDIEGNNLECCAHQFIVLFFKGAFDPKLQVNHINGIKKDNRIANLELVTSSENKKHAFRTGLMNQDGSKNPIAKLTEKQVLNIRQLLEKGIPIKQVAIEFSVSYSLICQIKTRKIWTHI